MATQIDKKDTKDLSESIADEICGRGAWIETTPSEKRHMVAIIQEGLNDWISECESEDAKSKWENQDTMLNYDIELNPDR